MEDAFAVASVAALEPDPEPDEVEALEGPELEAPDDEVDDDEPDEPEEVEEAQAPAGAASERPLTAREVEEHDRRRMEDLAQVGRRIVTRIEVFLREEADEVEVDEQVLPWILRFAAKSIEVRNRGGFSARPRGAQGAPASKVKVPFDPTHRARPPFRCHLGRSTIAHCAEG